MESKREQPYWSKCTRYTGERSVLLNLNEEPDAVEYSEILTTSEFLDMIVRESNRYAMRQNGYELRFTVAELHIYLGCLLVMSYIAIQAFRTIGTCLCDYHFQEKSNRDKYYKIRPFFELLLSGYKATLSDSGKKKVVFERPFTAKEYNKYIGGICGMWVCGMEVYTWYMRLFHHFIDVTVVNSWVIHRKLVPGIKSDFLEFKAPVPVSLLNKGMIRMRTSPARPGRRLPLPKRIVTQSVLKRSQVGRNVRALVVDIRKEKRIEVPQVDP
ncbi:hypothetical protein QYM36_000818 [Artemia franciscana]|uniref:PiggyBac transposable element-derived protein domain-containing protein n=1 Tax=Artemia franciscana TaxID=6661 RepID=A0AA88IGS8_ARTSF|nr:hypothetical protein QYM36_000818 [Artemia franciscana]